MSQALDLVLFLVGGTRYGAELSQVLRIELDERDHAVGEVLGPSASARRSLVFDRDGATARLMVDEVMGVQRVSVEDLRRLPPATGAPRHAAGAWLDGPTPVVLIDLARL